jgi:3-hydroxyanthranilate 3,4-dioxygenase
MERKRRDDEKDGLLWFCEKCNHKLYENYFTLTNIMTQFQETFQYFYNNDELKTCKKCGHKMEPPTPVVNPSNSESH